MIPYDLIRLLALLDDALFVDWCAEIGLTPAPEESHRAFRERVINMLERMNAEIDRLEQQ
jgi:hypothetical protein